MKNSLINYAANENNPKWENIIKRKRTLYSRNNDIRSEFERDYTRIIHNGNLQNMNLTYAVRDGIISHCGEIDENKLKPGNEFINLEDYSLF